MKDKHPEGILIQLNNHPKNVLISSEDIEKVRKYNWHFDDRYIKTNVSENGKQHLLLLHRYILDAKKGQEIDHINRDTFDNRRDNLRFCTSSQNKYNSPKQRVNISGYKGVGWHKASNRFRARIRVNRKLIELGNFLTKEVAARAYNEAAIKYHKEFAYLNQL